MALAGLVHQPEEAERFDEAEKLKEQFERFSRSWDKIGSGTNEALRWSRSKTPKNKHR